MLTPHELTDVLGSEAYSDSGDRIGKVGQVYLDDETDQPAWVTVHTGFLGMRESFVPLQRASYDGDRLVVPFDKATVRDAPHLDPDGHLGRDEEAGLYRYYGLHGKAPEVPEHGEPAAGTPGARAPRSEARPTERVRLTTRRTTDEEPVTADVRREHVDVEERR